MRVSYRVFWLPKAGLTEEEYEDAFAPDQVPDVDLAQFRCAVADGATETSFSRGWAEILCKAYKDRNFHLRRLQEEWLNEVSGKTLPWYAEQKLESGAYASIVGLSLRQNDSGYSWSARALGDSCLFHLRDGKILRVLPLDRWENFGSTPALISTKSAANQGLLARQKYVSGICSTGDLFYLMTDAISKWLLRRDIESGDAVGLLENIGSNDEFKHFVDEHRKARDDKGRPMMPNDDVTWTRVAVEP